MATGNNSQRPADVPPWAWMIIQEGRRRSEDLDRRMDEYHRQIVEFNRQAAEDRKQAAEDRKQAAADRRETAAHNRRLDRILDEIRQSNYDMKAVIVRSNDMHGIALERLANIDAKLGELPRHTRMLEQILAALKAGGNGRGGNGRGNGHGRR